MCQVYVQKKPGVYLADSLLRKRLSSNIKESIREAALEATPLLQLTIFDP
jgi:hypothetical protein